MHVLHVTVDEALQIGSESAVGGFSGGGGSGDYVSGDDCGDRGVIDSGQSDSHSEGMTHGDSYNSGSTDGSGDIYNSGSMDGSGDSCYSGSMDGSGDSYNCGSMDGSGDSYNSGSMDSSSFYGSGELVYYEYFFIDTTPGSSV